MSAADTANYFGFQATITLTKAVNGQAESTPPGLTIPVGDPVTFTYVVTNTGNVTLDPVTLDDSVLGAITCPQTTLDPGDAETCTAGGGDAVAGQYTNTATAAGQGVDNTGSPLVQLQLTDTAIANYFGEENVPAIMVVKQVNAQHQPTAPGLYVPVGSSVTFTTWSPTSAIAP